MMGRKSVVTGALFALVISLNSFGQGAPGETIQQRAARAAGNNVAPDLRALAGQIATIRGQLTGPQQEVDAIRKRIEGFETAVKEVDKMLGSSDLAGHWWNGRTQAQKDAVEQLEAKKQRLLADIADERVLITGVNSRPGGLREINGKLAAAEAQLNAMDTEHKELERVVRSGLSLNSTYQDLKGDLLSAETKMLTLERYFDNALVGNYLRDKLSRFASSDAFCDAASHCEGPKTKYNKGEGPDMSKVFLNKDGVAGQPHVNKKDAGSLGH